MIPVNILFNGLLNGNIEVQPIAIQNESIQQQIIIPENPEIDKLIRELSFCESGNNNLALNKIDKNGLSSKGTWQFQDKSWRYYIKKYDLWNWKEWEEADFENNVWDGEYQRVVVRKMFIDKDVDLRQEFPDCSKKLKLKKNYQ